MRDVGGAHLDTEIDGEPSSVFVVADWLSSTVGPGIEDGEAALHRSVAESASDWGGDSGLAFRARMREVRARVRSLHECALGMGGAARDYGEMLRICQQQMQEVRERARGSGLVVSGLLVLDPGPGPTRPSDRSGELMEDSELRAYESAVAAYNAHQERVEAFGLAVAEAAEVRAALATAESRLADEYQGMSWSDATLQSSDFVAGAVLTRLGRYQAGALRSTAANYADDAARIAQEMLVTDYHALDRLFGDGAGRRIFESQSGRQLQAMDDAMEATRRADDFDARGRYGGIARGIAGGLLGAGIVVDLAAGEGLPQAVASNLGGYAAGAGATMLTSMAVGAGIGTSVPVVGTAVGAVVGLGVGIFASGAIDSLFENGPDVGQAVEEGLDAVTDTVGAVGDAFEDAGDFVGDLF